MPDRTHDAATATMAERYLDSLPDENIRLVEPAGGWGVTPYELAQAINLVGMILAAQCEYYGNLAPLSILRLTSSRTEVECAERVLAAIANMADSLARRAEVEDGVPK